MAIDEEVRKKKALRVAGLFLSTIAFNVAWNMIAPHVPGLRSISRDHALFYVTAVWFSVLGTYLALFRSTTTLQRAYNWLTAVVFFCAAAAFQRTVGYDTQQSVAAVRS